jgi:hypothetical protein
VPIWLRVVLMTLLAAVCIVGLQLAVGSTSAGSFAVGIVLLALGVYGIVRLLQGWPREA